MEPSLGVILIVVTISLLVYFLPSYIAFARGVPSRYSILLINLLLGAVLIGWIVALVWSLVEQPQTAADGD